MTGGNWQTTLATSRKGYKKEACGYKECKKVFQKTQRKSGKEKNNARGQENRRLDHKERKLTVGGKKKKRSRKHSAMERNKKSSPAELKTRLNKTASPSEGSGQQKKDGKCVL